MNRRRFKAFTRTELLVAIGIVVLLCVVPLPALNEARQRRKSIVCLTNLHTLGSITFRYAQDHGGLVHRGVPFHTPAWYEDYIPYLGQSDNGDLRTYRIYRCPSYPVKLAAVTYLINGWDFSPGDPDAFGDGDIELFGRPR